MADSLILFLFVLKYELLFQSVEHFETVIRISSCLKCRMQMRERIEQFLAHNVYIKHTYHIAFFY